MKKDYMARLERAARWRLPPQEAEEVISDYREIVGIRPRSEEELFREVGDPEQVVKLLVSPPRAYYAWLAVFLALAACLLSAALAPLPLSPSFRLVFWYERGGELLGSPGFNDGTSLPIRLILTVLPILQLAAGAAVCLVWFLRRREKVHGPRSRGMILCALLLLAVIACVWLAVWRVSADPEPYFSRWTQAPVYSEDGITPTYGGKMSQDMVGLLEWLEYGGCALPGLVGMAALVKARTRDRRWAAVFLLALTAAVLSLDVLVMLANFHSMSPLDTYHDGWFNSCLPRFAAVTALGLAGSGVALC